MLGSDRPGKMPSLSFLSGNYHRARRDPQLPDTKGGRDGVWRVSGDILEHSGDSFPAVSHVDSDVALALAGVCSNHSAQQTEKSVDAQQYEATQPLQGRFRGQKYQQRRLGFVYRLWGLLGTLQCTMLEPGRGLVKVEMRNKSRLVPARPESSFPALADIVRLCRLSC